jgi:hypothetical protein
MTHPTTSCATSRGAHATEAEALAWATRLFAELPVAGLLGAQPRGCDPHAERMTVTFEARRDVLCG